MPRQYEEISGAMWRPDKIKISVTFHEVEATQDHHQLFDAQSESTGQQTLKEPNVLSSGDAFPRVWNFVLFDEAQGN